VAVHRHRTDSRVTLINRLPQSVRKSDGSPLLVTPVSGIDGQAVTQRAFHTRGDNASKWMTLA
jgi:hypothetical protein